MILFRPLPTVLALIIASLATFPFALAESPASAPALPEVTFFTISAGRPANVIFVLDHSGSMLDSFDYLRQAVKRSLKNLSDKQRFAIVMFSKSPDFIFPAQPAAPRKKDIASATHLAPVAATDANKKAAGDFLDVIKAQGQNCDIHDPFIDALMLALVTDPKPDAIYFLTDRSFDPKIVESFRKLNTAKIPIHTLAFVRILKETEDSLKKIAADSGGTYKFIAESDLTE